ncbi:MAG: radical SAM protein [Candidatus Omnitrophica bacterium]|nr:radical SAM protein [Candidatus Omnitrophota bacterium]
MSVLLDSIYAKVEALRVPLHILLELTQACNENCIHCYIKGAKDRLSFSKDKKELSLGRIIGLLDELQREGALNLTLSGGEAILRNDFFEIAKAARQRNFALALFSNGQLIDKENADRLKEIMPVCVYFSVYGKDASTHDRITRLEGSFKKLFSAIELLRQRGVKIGLKTVVMKENFTQLKEVFELGKYFGAEAHQFTEEITTRIDGTCPGPCQIDGCSLYDYYKGDIPQPREYIEELKKEEALRKPLCAAAASGACISAYGDVYPCAELRVPLGNVKYASFADIWRKEEGFLEEFLETREYGDLPECRQCDLISFCRRCPGRAFYETGDWRGCYEHARERALLSKRINEELAFRR